VLVEHPGNVRTELRDLDELEASVRAKGILQPLLVTRTADDRYVVIGGHRRLAVAVRLDLPRVPVMLRTGLDGALAIEAMLVENLQRDGLDPLDEAIAYQQLIRGGRTQADIAKAVGKNQGYISQRLALLNLTPDEQAALRRKEITIQAGYRAGRDRSANRRPNDTRRPKPKRVPHFTRQHPLSTAAAARCGHETTLKLGVACGPCWEATIRADQAGAAS
jgi:ParB family chromosome partitioning protein